jgi:hypothetical protein
MRIEVLYVPGCPNYHPAVKRLQSVLKSQSLQAEIRSVPINSEDQARALLFPGSPTVPGRREDVEQRETATPSLSCRLYANRSGIPSEESLRIAISNAKTERVKVLMRVAERVTSVAAVVAALSTLACCLPFAFLGALGLTGASVKLQSDTPRRAGGLMSGAASKAVALFLKSSR